MLNDFYNSDYYCIHHTNPQNAESVCTLITFTNIMLQSMHRHLDLVPADVESSRLSPTKLRGVLACQSKCPRYTLQGAGPCVFQLSRSWLWLNFKPSSLIVSSTLCRALLPFANTEHDAHHHTNISPYIHTCVLVCFSVWWATNSIPHTLSIGSL